MSLLLDASGSARHQDQQFLTFALGHEEYAIDILRVQEIKGYAAVTPIPNTPPHIKGVLNLRGTVVPIIDLRLKLGMEPAAYDKFTVIVVIAVANRQIGLVVDSVADVIGIGEDAITPPPELGAGVDTAFMRGMAKHEDRLVSILDIEEITGIEESATS
jgi:purine-binding chemotaxis protein CheW